MPRYGAIKRSFAVDATGCLLMLLDTFRFIGAGHPACVRYLRTLLAVGALGRQAPAAAARSEPRSCRCYFAIASLAGLLCSIRSPLAGSAGRFIGMLSGL